MYDKEGATYLFDLDYVDDEYTVDAAHYGNISHFVNHSVSGLYYENLNQTFDSIKVTYISLVE